MHVIKPGVEVYVDPDRTKRASVLKALIEGESLHVCYECVYWVDGKRESAWFSSFEVSTVYGEIENSVSVELRRE